MSVLLGDPFYRVAAAAGSTAACVLSLLPLLAHGFQLLQERLSSSSSSSSSSSKAAARTVHPSPKTLAFRIILMVPVYALTSLLAFLYCSPLDSLPPPAAAAAGAPAAPAAPAAAAPAAAAAGEAAAVSAAAGAAELSPRAAVAAAAAAAAALQQRSGGWGGLWLRGAREAYEVAMYALILFYMAVQRPLSPWRPLPKFLCLKSIVFLCFWQSLALRWIAGLFLTGTGDSAAAAPAAAAAAAAAAARLQDWLICIEMVPCAIAHLWAFPAWEFEAFEKAEGQRAPYSCSSAAADEWSTLLRQGDHRAASAAAAAAAAGVRTATYGAEGRTHDDEPSGSSSNCSSSSSSSKLKKPLQQLASKVQQLLLSDTVLSDATHAVFGPQQQQREFNLETRSPAAALHS
ncbi:hypothetical protein, conserved [Eimeria brunetti]|uniref:Uncharacterized protein n=1 Tax=Eimeria brunetti TaxID=51314 RepID=U6LIE3_9EIME|nr:hypothetical protein, conserved [Eimeria brunetti]